MGGTKEGRVVERWSRERCGFGDGEIRGANLLSPCIHHGVQIYCAHRGSSGVVSRLAC